MLLHSTIVQLFDFYEARSYYEQVEGIGKDSPGTETPTKCNFILSKKCTFEMMYTCDKNKSIQHRLKLAMQAEKITGF